jgi:alkanesulfonate monooxygenase SsuD/methylene tetrahydromethanopterin reductase-like flavin-dependent oxidoreductase (luciferase family)
VVGGVDSAGQRLSVGDAGEQVVQLRALPGLQAVEQGIVVIAAAGPQALAAAGAEADIVTLAAPPATTRDQVRWMADRVRDHAGTREVELSMNVFVVGAEVPPWMAGFVHDPSALPDDTLALLRGSPREMADELLRRRDTLGVTYFAVGETFADPFAPVVELLAGQR